ncbi:hypothetical protein DMB66_33215 [Actinoplanes sp. ATCC 53533]|nr:hypothetical protein DMB66_33215 [Actinoplanes sp. ATCC 53533]
MCRWWWTLIERREPEAVPDDIAVVEARIARELARLADVPATAGCDRSPLAYVRRHLVEHAAAGGTLTSRVVPDAFVPYLDPARLRAVGTSVSEDAFPLLRAVREVTYQWRWSDPAHNAAALSMQAILGHRAGDAEVGGVWRGLWRIEGSDHNEVLARLPRVYSLGTASLADGRVFAVAATSGYRENAAVVWDLTTGTAIAHVPTGHDEGIAEVITAVLPDGGAVAMTRGWGDRGVRVWRLPDGAPVGTPLVMPGHVRAMATATLPDRRVLAVTGDSNGTLQTWDLAIGAPLGPPLTAPGGGVLTVALAGLPDGRVIAITVAGHGRAVQARDLSTGRLTWQLPTGSAGLRAIAVAPLDDGRTVAVTGDSDGALHIRDVESGTLIAEAPSGHRGGLSTLAVAELGDGRRVAVSGGSDDAIRLWDLASATKLGGSLVGFVGSSVCAVATAVLPDRRVVAVTANSGGGDDGTVRIWDLARALTGPSVKIRGHAVIAVAAAQLPDGTAVAVTGGLADGVITVCDLRTGRVISTFDCSTDGVYELTTAVLPNKRVVALIAGSPHNHVVQLRDVSSGALIANLTGHTGWVESLATAVLPDGRVVGLTGGGFGDATVRVWDLTDGRAVAVLRANGNGGYQALATATLPGGRLIVLAGRAGPYPLHGWDLATKAPFDLPPISHGPGIAAAAVVTMPDNRVVVVTGGYGDGTVVTWDLSTGTRVAEVRIAEPGVIDSLATATLADGRIVGITAGHRENQVRVWDVRTGVPIGPPLVTPFDVRALAVHQAELPVLVMGGYGTAAVELRHEHHPFGFG